MLKIKKLMYSIVSLICIIGFQIYSVFIINKVIASLRNRVTDLEQYPKKMRKIPKELDSMNWLTSSLKDGTEICTISLVFTYNNDAIEYYNKIMNLLGSVHAQVYQAGTWIKLPKNDPASLRISWYKDFMKVYQDDNLEK